MRTLQAVFAFLTLIAGGVCILGTSLLVHDESDAVLLLAYGPIVIAMAGATFAIGIVTTRRHEFTIALAPVTAFALFPATLISLGDPLPMIPAALLLLTTTFAGLVMNREWRTDARSA